MTIMLYNHITIYMFCFPAYFSRLGQVPNEEPLRTTAAGFVRRTGRMPFVSFSTEGMYRDRDVHDSDDDTRNWLKRARQWAH